MKIKNTLLASVLTAVVITLSMPALAENITSNSNQNNVEQYRGDGQGYGKGYGHKGQNKKRGKGKSALDPIEVKVKLNLTEAQLPAWQSWKNAVELAKENRMIHKQKMQEKRRNDPKPNVLEMSNNRILNMENRLQDMKTVHAAFTVFYNVLTPEQQTEMVKCMKKFGGKKGRKGQGRNRN